MSLEAIKAKIAAAKAAQAAAAAPTPAPTPAVVPVVAPVVVTDAPFEPDPVVEPEVVEEVAASEADQFAGLSGIQLILAKQKAALAKKQAFKAAPSATKLGGAVGGTGASVATEVTRPADLQRSLFTPAEQRLQAAKDLMQQKQEAGFYKVNEPSKFPVDLPADAVEAALADLDAALIMRTPELRSLLIRVNQNLRQYDELAYLLKDEQLGLIVQANLAVKNTELLTTTKGKGSKISDKTVASLDADDI